jgi:hypothetical protein
MRYEETYISCSPDTLHAVAEVAEIRRVLSAVPWCPGLPVATTSHGRPLEWQEAYNRLIELEFAAIGGWTPFPILSADLSHKGDFAKNGVFVEVQFGNSATVYRDYYKFHYGWHNGLLSLAVLVVPSDPVRFFPARDARSIRNMASYEYARAHFLALALPTPVLLLGLMAGV